MQKSLLLVLLIFNAGVCFSQSVGDLFSQDKASQGTPADCSNPSMAGSAQCAQPEAPNPSQGRDASTLPLRTPVLTAPEGSNPDQFAPAAPPQNPSQITRSQMTVHPETEFQQMVAD